MAHFEKELDRQELYRGCVFTVTTHRVGLEDGGESRRDVVNHNGGACVAAVDEEGRILLVRQYRFAVGRELLELPAGKLEPGEDPRTAAARELTEETGRTAASLVKLTEVLPTPAYCTERIYVYEAQGLSGAGDQHLDRDEFLDVVPVPLDRAVEMVLSGEITDAKTQAGVLMVAARRAACQTLPGTAISPSP